MLQRHDANGDGWIDETERPSSGQGSRQRQKRSNRGQRSKNDQNARRRQRQQWAEEMGVTKQFSSLQEARSEMQAALQSGDNQRVAAARKAMQSASQVMRDLRQQHRGSAFQ
jgi:hypothetical protein